jgi:DNA-binding NtrC family response regulator
MHRQDDDATTLHRAGKLAPSATAFWIDVIEGPDAGARLFVDPGAPARALVGKSEACSLRLADPAVSRRHLSLSAEGPELHLSDLRSTNGTFVQGVRVAEAFLRGGEIVALGGTKLRVTPAQAAGAQESDGPEGFGRLLGRSPAMQRLYPLLAKLAQANVPVVIEGETGTGKEVAAEALHEQGPRASGPFVVFDCTTVAPNLMEAALFGHERGAFTGALASKKGVFEEAHGGTLLIDEIGDLELSLQPKLLRAIQRREVRRVGGDRWIQVDVRVIAATRRDLDREVQAGRFREDLFFRLAVGRVELPPLRERRGDVALLSRLFWDRLGGADRPIPYEQFEAFEDYPWPGNVRELENAVARRLALGELAPPAGLASVPPPPPLPGTARSAPPSGSIEVPFEADKPLAVARETALAAFERAYVERLIALHGGRAAEAAAKAGVGRRYLNMLRARFGV